MIQFLTANWLWIAAIVLLVAMHRSGHGCGMHGSHGDKRDDHQAGPIPRRPAADQPWPQDHVTESARSDETTPTRAGQDS
jgi:hypothetical protein